MPFYKQLKKPSRSTRGSRKEQERVRTIDRLLKLRKALREEIPARTLDESLLIATWNIRDFDKPSFGRRMKEAYFYIAEIIASFDLVAVQEVYRDLDALDEVMHILGPHWDYIFSDPTEGAKGNNERMAFLYDSRKIKFGGLAGEMVIPPVEKRGEPDQPAVQIWRTPFMAGFKAGWTKFILTTIHALYGESKAGDPQRVREVRAIAEFLKKKSQDSTAWARNIILLGDFNIFHPKAAEFEELTKVGFEVPEELQKLPSNASQDKHFDQIAFMSRPGSLAKTGQAGVFNFFDVVFRDNDEDKEIYRPYMTNFETTTSGKPRTDRSKQIYYRTYWRTHQMSDHFPMWVELKMDFSDEYLEYLK
jgi:endonuclease/exonuclease/phosphatase family metal-dependent hydrolase